MPIKKLLVVNWLPKQLELLDRTRRWIAELVWSESGVFESGRDEQEGTVDEALEWFWFKSGCALLVWPLERGCV